LSLWEWAKRTCRMSWNNDVFGQSARLAFYLFFALFPVLLLLLILLSKATRTNLGPRGALLDSFNQVLPPDASALMAETVAQINAKAMVGAGAVMAAVSAVWGALNGTWGIMIGLNRAYEVKEERPWWQVLAVAIGLTVCLSVAGIIGLTALFYGRVALHHSAATPRQHTFSHIALWAELTLLLLVSFAVLYRFGPNLKDRRWQWSIPGSLVAVSLWLGFTLLLRLYQKHASASVRIYGGLSAVVTLLLWLYLTSAAILIGGEANSEIEKAAAEASQTDVRGAKQPRGGHRSGQRGGHEP
jgi:membrane protein